MVLTLLGGGVFGNNMRWILGAIWYLQACLPSIRWCACVRGWILDAIRCGGGTDSPQTAKRRKAVRDMCVCACVCVCVHVHVHVCVRARICVCVKVSVCLKIR